MSLGQVLLDKNPPIRTVVNKTGSIDETFRTFHMELLAGDDDMICTVGESGCSFKFDFSKVYWNSKLQTEHKRVIDLCKKDDIVIDMFAGVGPFAIPAGKKGCHVFANDLNPFSYSALLDNSQTNKVAINTYNLEGRDFIHQVKDKVIELIQATPRVVLHIVMNLPAIAIEFLDCFKGFYDSIPQPTNLNEPMIHCYSFSKSSSPDFDVLERVQKVLGVQLESYNIHTVRDVSPNKMMMRISFSLPVSVLCTTGTKRE